MCPPESVATGKSQDMKQSEKMAETHDLHFKVYDSENVPSVFQCAKLSHSRNEFGDELHPKLPDVPESPQEH